MSRNGSTTRDRVGGRTVDREGPGRVRSVRGRSARSRSAQDRAAGGRSGDGAGREPAGRALPGRFGAWRRRRQARVRTPRRRVLQVVAVVLVLAAAAGWLVFAGPVLAVHEVAVDGARTLTPDQVRTAAGIPAGTALARVDTDAAAARVAALPQVASVEVVRGWPDSVVITLAERVPVAVVDLDGVRSLVDATGTLFDTVTGAVPAGVVPVDVPTPGPDDRATRVALAVLTSLPAAVRSTVTDLRAATADDVTLTLTGGRTVLWGSEGDADRKARVLAALIAQIDAGTLDPAGTIDVSVPDSVLLR